MLAAILLEHPVPIAVGLIGLTVWLWHHYVIAIVWPWSVQVRWKADIERERRAEHANRAQELHGLARRRGDNDYQAGVR